MGVVFANRDTVRLPKWLLLLSVAWLLELPTPPGPWCLPEEVVTSNPFFSHITTAYCSLLLLPRQYLLCRVCRFVSFGAPLALVFAGFSFDPPLVFSLPLWEA